MAKRRAAFLLKQQRKAEEARIRKQQQEVESEVKRDEARYVFTHSNNMDKGLSKVDIGVYRIVYLSHTEVELNLFPFFKA